MKNKRFLIVHTFGMGDMIMFIPALELLINQFPKAKFDFFIGYPPTADIVRTYPQTNQIIYRKSGFNLLRQIFELRAQNYDYVVVTSGHSAWKSELFTKLLNAGCTLGEGQEVKKQKSSHRIVRNLRIVSPLTGMEYDIPVQPKLRTEGWIDNNSDKTILEIISEDKKYFGIHCGSRTTQAYKRWPTESFVQLLTQIDRNCEDAFFLIFATHDEAEEAQIINNQLSHCSRIIFDKPLQVVAALLLRCRLMIANDSGLGHLAAALGTPTLSLFGPSDPRKCAPVGEHCRYIKVDDFCTPCIADSVPPKCREIAECMIALKPEAVFTLVAEMLDFSKDPGAMVKKC